MLVYFARNLIGIGMLLIAVVCVVLAMIGAGQGEAQATMIFTATPQPVAELSSDVILAQGVVAQMGVVATIALRSSAADLAATHPTATPVPTPRPSEGERIVKQAVFPVLSCGAIVGVIFLGTLAILAWESNRRRQDDALRRQQELDKMKLERDMLQAKNEAEARQVGGG